MSDLNKVILCGRLGSEPECKYTQNGKAFLSISMATTDKWNDRETNETREKTQWHRLVFWGRPAEIIDKYCGKGDLLLVEGKLTHRKWKTDEGQERWTTEVNVFNFQLIGNNRRKEEGGGQRQRASTGVWDPDDDEDGTSGPWDDKKSIGEEPAPWD